METQLRVLMKHLELSQYYHIGKFKEALNRFPIIPRDARTANVIFSSLEYFPAVSSSGNSMKKFWDVIRTILPDVVDRELGLFPNYGYADTPPPSQK